jgi:CheY-like chemotaxis protein
MAQDSGLPVIMITGHGDVPMAVEAMRIGAFDFLEKPFNPDKMTELAKKASQQRRMTLDNRALRRELSRRQGGDEEADRRLARDGAAARGHPRSRPGRQPCADRRRDGDGQDAGGPCAACGGAAGGAKKFITLVSCSAYAEQQLAEKLFGPDPRRGAAAGGGGARRHAVLEDIEALPNAPAGAASDLHQRAGHAAPDPHHRDLQRCRTAGKTLEDAAPRPVLPALGDDDHLPAAQRRAARIS